MESIRELRRRCQTVHSEDFSARLVRSVSIYFTRALLPTGISANAVSFCNVAIGVAAGGLFAVGYESWTLAGLLLFTLNTILDGCDGEVARYRQQSSLTGLFADRVNSFFAYPALFGGIALGLQREFSSDWILLPGVLAVWSTCALRLTRSTVDTTVIDGLTASKAKQEGREPRIASPDYTALADVVRNKSKIWYAIDFVLVRQPGVNLVVGGVVAASMVTPTACGLVCSPLYLLLWGYGAAYTLMTLAGLLLIVRGRRAEATLDAVKARTLAITDSQDASGST